MTDFAGFVKEADLIGGAWSGADNSTKIDVKNPARTRYACLAGLSG